MFVLCIKGKDNYEHSMKIFAISSTLVIFESRSGLSSKARMLTYHLFFFCLFKDIDWLKLFGGGTNQHQYTKGKELEGNVTAPMYHDLRRAAVVKFQGVLCAHVMAGLF